MSQETIAILMAVCSLVLSAILFTIQRWDMRRRELWWAVVEDGRAQKGVPITFRLYRYIGKTKPPKKHRLATATAIRGYVVAGESLIGRETMKSLEAIRLLRERRDQGAGDPVPDEVHPPKITMVPLKVVRYRRTKRFMRHGSRNGPGKP